MAMSFSDGGVYQLVVEGNFLVNTQLRNIFHMRLETGGILNQAQGVEDLQEFTFDLYDGLKAYFSEDVTWTSTSIYALEGTNLTGSIGLDNAIEGTGTGTPLPPGVCMLSYMPLGESRRQLRKYWGVLPSSLVNTNGDFGSTNANAVNAIIAPFLLTTYEGTNGAWRFGHYTTGLPDSFVVPQAVRTSLNPSYQRRRRAGSGS